MSAAASEGVLVPGLRAARDILVRDANELRSRIAGTASCQYGAVDLEFAALIMAATRLQNHLDLLAAQDDGL